MDAEAAISKTGHLSTSSVSSLTLDDQFVRLLDENRCRYAVAGDVVRPSHGTGRGDLQIMRAKPQSTALPRSEHQSVWTEHHRRAVTVGGAVMHP